MADLLPVHAPEVRVSCSWNAGNQKRRGCVQKNLSATPGGLIVLGVRRQMSPVSDGFRPVIVYLCLAKRETFQRLIARKCRGALLAGGIVPVQILGRLDRIAATKPNEIDVFLLNTFHFNKLGVATTPRSAC